MCPKSTAEPRKLPQQDRSRMMVEAILEATARILTEKGYSKTNTNHIAELAGVSIGSLYQYFPNKESLMAALIQQHSDEMVELVESKLNNSFDTPLEEAIPQLVRAIIAAHAINPRLHQVLNEEIPLSRELDPAEKIDDRINQILLKYLERWRDRLAPQDLKMTVFIFAHTIESLCHAAVIEEQQYMDNDDFEREVCRLLLSYLIGDA
jgi:AcrR family transcriptional regulator